MSGSRLSFTRLLAEVVSVIFAVLVALALDEWWEDRENDAMADASLAAIAREIRENRQELATENQEDIAGMMTRLDSAIALFERGETPEGASVNWDLALLSSAAWETAQLNRATTYMPLDRVVELAQVYEVQRYYGRIQDDLFDGISGLRAGDEIADELRGLRSRLATALGLRDNLAALYACTLVSLEGPGAAEAEECPEGEESARRPRETPSRPSSWPRTPETPRESRRHLPGRRRIADHPLSARSPSPARSPGPPGGRSRSSYW